MYIRVIKVVAYSMLIGSLFSGCANRQKQKYWKLKPPAKVTKVEPAPEPKAPKAPKESKSRWFRSNKASAVEKKTTPDVKPSTGLPSLQISTPKKYVPPTTTTAITSAYRLKPGDPVLIGISGIPVPSSAEDVLDERGYISLTYIGNVRALGLTSSELEKEIERQYLEKKIYRHINVNVIVPTRYYFIRGEVRQPGRHPLLGKVSVLQAIAAAGGFNEFAKEKDISITRGNQIIPLNFKEIQKSPEKDMYLQADDSIFVPRAIW